MRRCDIHFEIKKSNSDGDTNLVKGIYTDIVLRGM